MRFVKIFILLLGFIITFNMASHAQDAETTEQTEEETAAPEPVKFDPADPENHLVLDLSTGGRVTITLYPHIAPKHVERIKRLAREGFYDGIVFHRVIEGFMAQTGDPTGTGQGGSELPNLQAEFTRNVHVRGAVSMARTGDDENSANSQFFIVFQPRFSLDNNYSLFGRVKSGMQYVDAIQRGEPPRNPDRIIQASVGSDNKAPPVIEAAPEDDTLPEGEVEVSIID